MSNSLISSFFFFFSLVAKMERFLAALFVTVAWVPQAEA